MGFHVSDLLGALVWGALPNLAPHGLGTWLRVVAGEEVRMATPSSVCVRVCLIGPGSGSRGVGRRADRRSSGGPTEEIGERGDRRTGRRFGVRDVDRTVVLGRGAVGAPETACATLRRLQSRPSAAPEAPGVPAFCEMEGSPLKFGLICSTIPTRQGPYIARHFSGRSPKKKGGE